MASTGRFYTYYEDQRRRAQDNGAVLIAAALVLAVSLILPFATAHLFGRRLGTAWLILLLGEWTGWLLLSSTMITIVVLAFAGWRRISRRIDLISLRVVSVLGCAHLCFSDIALYQWLDVNQPGLLSPYGSEPGADVILSVG